MSMASESFLHAYYTRNECLVSWITLSSRILFFISSFFFVFVCPGECALEVVRKNIHISAKDFVARTKVNVINSFIGFEHETAGVLLIFISAFLWASKNGWNVSEARERPLKYSFFDFGVPQRRRWLMRALSFVNIIFSCRLVMDNFISIIIN